MGARHPHLERVASSQHLSHRVTAKSWLLAAAATATAAAAVAVTGCGAEEASPSVRGTADLRFSITTTVRKSRNLVDPLKGSVYGGLFYADDVGLTGPVEGARDLDIAVEVPNVDLTNEATSTSIEAFITPDLEPARYTFLGFFDVDGNGAESRQPESGDPVTLPGNTFEVVAGKRMPHVVRFDLVYNE